MKLIVLIMQISDECENAQKMTREREREKKKRPISLDHRPNSPFSSYSSPANLADIPHSARGDDLHSSRGSDSEERR